MDDEQYINIEDGLSVGAVKYVDPSEIITEEDFNYIKNKIPELDERVGVIDDEIKEINSSLDNKVNFYDEDYAKTIERPYSVGSQSINGSSKASPSIIQQDYRDYTINVVGNESTIKGLKIINTNNLPNKIGIQVLPSQRHHISDLIIHGYDTGISMIQSYYNYINDVFIRHCKRGLLLGNPSQNLNWVGAMTFDSIRFNNDIVGVENVALDNTNSITFDKCSFEGVNHCFKNSGQLHIKNTYLGDQQQCDEVVGEPDYLVKSLKGSKTYFTDCNLGMINRNYSTGVVDSPTCTGLANLQGTDDEPCEVYLKGGNIQISNNNLATTAQGLTTLYVSSSKNNKLFVDNVEFLPSDENDNHNLIPYVLYEGYSCLRSINPVSNYVLNGTFNNNNENEMLTSSNPLLTFDETLTNPFGGKVLKIGADCTLNIKYKVPSNLVGKLMTLEFYVCDAEYTKVRMSRAGSDCVETNDSYFSPAKISYGYKAPKLIRLAFTPTKQFGNIRFINKWDATKPLVIASIILKEELYKFKLSCYKDVNNVVYNSSAPTVGKWNTGDKVYNTNPKANSYEGWVCIDGDGTSVGTWKGFGLIET